MVATTRAGCAIGRDRVPKEQLPVGPHASHDGECTARLARRGTKVLAALRLYWLRSCGTVPVATRCILAAALRDAIPAQHETTRLRPRYYK